jgi:hypothetical protein
LPSEYGSDSWTLPLISFRTLVNRRTRRGTQRRETNIFQRVISVRPRKTKAISKTPMRGARICTLKIIFLLFSSNPAAEF